MERFIAEFAFWLLATSITMGVIIALDITAPTLVVFLSVAAIWAVLTWGGILILNNLDF